MSRIRDNYEGSRWRKFRRWLDGEVDLLALGVEVSEPKKGPEPGPATQALPVPGPVKPLSAAARRHRYQKDNRGIRPFRKAYQLMSVALCLGIISVLLWTVSYLPAFGNAGNPDNNEVSARYIDRKSVV